MYKNQINCNGHVGCMFAGKTTALLDAVEKRKNAGYNVICFTYAGDKRYGDGITTHDKHTHEAHSVASLEGVSTETYIPLDVSGKVAVFFDEVQFIKGVAIFCLELVQRGIPVVWAGLDADYKMEPWDEVSRLMGFSKYTKHYAVCFDCGNEDAIFSVPAPNVQITHVESIGGTEKWKAICTSCKFAKQKKL